MGRQREPNRSQDTVSHSIPRARGSVSLTVRIAPTNGRNERRRHATCNIHINVVPDGCVSACAG